MSNYETVSQLLHYILILRLSLIFLRTDKNGRKNPFSPGYTLLRRLLGPRPFAIVVLSESDCYSICPSTATKSP